VQTVIAGTKAGARAAAIKTGLFNPPLPQRLPMVTTSADKLHTVFTADFGRRQYRVSWVKGSLKKNEGYVVLTPEDGGDQITISRDAARLMNAWWLRTKAVKIGQVDGEFWGITEQGRVVIRIAGGRKVTRHIWDFLAENSEFRDLLAPPPPPPGY
jgi:hypothetical protein